MTALRRALISSSIVWALLLPLAPFAASQPAPARFWYALAFVVYGAGSVVCHQLPERSFFLGSVQWPVCARCAGIYMGAAVAAMFATVRRPPSPRDGDGAPKMPDLTHRSPRLMLAVAAVPTVATLVFEWTTGDMPSHVIRALAGALLGAAVVLVVVRALRLRRISGPSA